MKLRVSVIMVTAAVVVMAVCVRAGSASATDDDAAASSSVHRHRRGFSPKSATWHLERVDSRTDEELAAEGVPRGHLRPLGSHRRFSGAVDELTQMPTPEYFWREYIRGNRPVILRGVGVDTPAYNKWDMKYLRDYYGEMDVKMERRKEARGVPYIERSGSDVFSPRRLRMRDFMELFLAKDIYAVSITPNAMLDEVLVPPCVLCGNRRLSGVKENAQFPYVSLIAESDLWISHGRTASMLHYDADQNINCLFGEHHKEWIFVNTTKFLAKIPWAEADRFNLQEMMTTESTDYATFDIDSIDLKKYPEFADVEWTHVTQYPGDCIYVPYTYLHQVTKPDTGFSIAVTYMFLRTEYYDAFNCQNAPMAFIPLGSFDLLWYYSGMGVLPLGYDHPENVRREFAQEASMADPTSFMTPPRRIIPKTSARLFWILRLGRSANPEYIISARSMERFETFWASLVTTMGYSAQQRNVTVEDVMNAPIKLMLELSVYTDHNLNENNDALYHTKPELESIRDARRIGDIDRLWRISTGLIEPENTDVRDEVSSVPGFASALESSPSSLLYQPQIVQPPPYLNYSHPDIPTSRCIDCVIASPCVTYQCVERGPCGDLCSHDMLVQSGLVRDGPRESFEDIWWDDILERGDDDAITSLRESAGFGSPRLDDFIRSDVLSDKDFVKILRRLFHYRGHEEDPSGRTPTNELELEDNEDDDEEDDEEFDSDELAAMRQRARLARDEQRSAKIVTKEGARNAVARESPSAKIIGRHVLIDSFSAAVRALSKVIASASSDARIEPNSPCALCAKDSPCHSFKCLRKVCSGQCSILQMQLWAKVHQVELVDKCMIAFGLVHCQSLECISEVPDCSNVPIAAVYQQYRPQLRSDL